MDEDDEALPTYPHSNKQANDDAADDAPDNEAKIQELPEDEATRD